MSQPARPIRLYSFPQSGHGHRIQLFLSILNLPYEIIKVDLLVGAHKQPDFLKLNPFGQIPVLDDDGLILTDSHAMLVYLALKYGDTSWLPTDPEGAAAVQLWLSVSAGQIAYGPSTARVVNILGVNLDQARAQTIAHDTFRIIEAHLSARQFLVGNSPTIADIAGYTYIAHAPEGDISLEPYPQIRQWLGRIEQLPGFIPMVKTPVGLSA